MVHYDNSHRLYLGLSLFIILLYFVPYIYLGTDACIQIHDNLDSNLVWAKLAMQWGGPFPSIHSQPIPQIMNELPVVSLNQGLNIGYILIYIFGPFWGYVVNKIVLSLIAFLGMYLLLNTHLYSNKAPRFLAYCVAVAFALLPFWSFMLSIAGVPLVLYVFLNFRKDKSRPIYWLLILLYASYSSIVLVGIFLLIVLGLVFLWDTARNRKFNYLYAAGLAWLFIALLACNYLILTSHLLGSGYVSHRKEFIFESYSLRKSLEMSWNMLISGQYHAHSLHTYFILPTVVAGFLIKLYKKEKDTVFDFLIIYILLTSLFYGLYNWSAVSKVKHLIFSVFPIQLQRFHFLHPVFWSLLFAKSLLVLIDFNKYTKYVLLSLLILQIGLEYSYNEHFLNKGKPSYKAFYAEKQFSTVKEHIGLPLSSYRVATLGMHPAIAQYNGLYTLDGYIAEYPLPYKHAFRKVIATELAKEPVLKKYYDNWGSRCYMFSAILGKNFMWVKEENHKLSKVEFDFQQFKKLGGQYIISCVEIEQPSVHMKLEGIYNDTESAWKIFLYKVI